jgi:hypothetical protein
MLRLVPPLRLHQANASRHMPGLSCCRRLSPAGWCLVSGSPLPSFSMPWCKSCTGAEAGLQPPSQLAVWSRPSSRPCAAC